MPQGLTARDIAIIGGGPAGCAAAILLARAGRDVVLFEREAGAHEKVCGGFLSWEAAHYLRSFGLDPPSLGAAPITHVRLIAGRESVETQLPFAAWSLSRHRLDDALLAAAAVAGADIRRGEKVTGLTQNDEDWSLTFAHGADITARIALLATGKHDLRGRPRRMTRSWPRPAQDMIGFKMHYRLTPSATDTLRRHVEIYLFDGGYAGLELVEDDIANLCLVVRQETYAAAGGTWPSLLDRLTAATPELARRLTGALPLWPRPLAIAGIPYGYLFKGAGTSGLFHLGDQMAVIPSFAGDGMSLALHSGTLAARAILRGDSVSSYHAQARRDLAPPVRNASLLSWLVAHSMGRKLLPLSRYAPTLLRLGIKSVRLRKAMIVNESRTIS